jgi:hypothetical protein
MLQHREFVLIDRAVSGKSVGFYPFNLLASGQMTFPGVVALLNLVHELIGIGLLFVAVLYLYKTKDHRDLHTAA